EAESSTARVAWVDRAAPPPLTPALQPEIVPSSVAKMNSEVPLFLPSLTTNDVLPGTSKSGLKTMPVGVESPLEPAGDGMVTDGRTGLMFPASSKSAEVPWPLSLFQKSPGFLAATPKVFLKSGSTWSAATAPSEIRFEGVKNSVGPPGRP